MGCDRLCGCCLKKSEHDAGARRKMRSEPLTDISYVRQMESWMVITRPRRREPLWAVTDETIRNWLKQAVKRAEADGAHFSIPVTPHTFRHNYIMHMLYHRQPKKVIQALAGHKDPRSIEVYTRVFALDMRQYWPYRLPATDMMPRKSSGHSPLLSDNVTHHSLYKLW